MTKSEIGKNCNISKTAIINENVVIEENVTIGDFCVIGFNPKNELNKKLIIRKNSIINSHSVIYIGSEIGLNNIIGHNVLIREETFLGKNVQVGSYSDLEGYCSIDDYSKLHSCVHVGQHSKIMSYVYIFPYVVLTNDPIPPSDIRQGVVLEPFSIICTRATILPGIKVGFSSFIGANSLVNKNVDPELIGSGNPFRIKGNISNIKIPKTNKSAYPWVGRFQKDYPQDIKDIYEKLRIRYLKFE
tara:strand:+ start:334 stop:1065 length:732 start_codon:yes stop_codon:yes gene_type:complete